MFHKTSLILYVCPPQALVIFSRYFIEPHTISILTILPFFAHSLFWVLTEAESLSWLFVYNWIFLFVGFITIVSSVVSNGKRISIILSSLCICEVSCNLFTYCWDMSAKECRVVFEWIYPDNYKISLMVGISSIALTLILSCVGAGKLIKARYYHSAEVQGKKSSNKIMAARILRRKISNQKMLKEE
jgi:hypothetical protein